MVCARRVEWIMNLGARGLLPTSEIGENRTRGRANLSVASRGMARKIASLTNAMLLIDLGASGPLRRARSLASRKSVRQRVG